MIIFPDTSTLQANTHGSIPLPSTLSPTGITTTIVPGLKSSSMLSLGLLCDDGCNIILDKHNMYAIKYKEVVIEGEQNHHYGIWDIIIPSYTNYRRSVQKKLHHNSISCKSLCRNS